MASNAKKISLNWSKKPVQVEVIQLKKNTAKNRSKSFFSVIFRILDLMFRGQRIQNIAPGEHHFVNPDSIQFLRFTK